MTAMQSWLTAGTIGVLPATSAFLFGVRAKAVAG